MIQNENAGQQRQNFGMAFKVGKTMEALPYVRKAEEVDKITASLVRMANEQSTNNEQDLLVNLGEDGRIIAHTKWRNKPPIRNVRDAFLADDSKPQPIEIPIKRGFLGRLFYGNDYEQLEKYSQRMAKDRENASTIAKLVKESE